MQCKVAMGYLDAFRTGELAGEQNLVIARHLGGCLSCTRQLARLRHLSLLATQMATATPHSILEHVLEETADRYGEIQTEIGRVLVGFNARGITMILPSAAPAAAFEQVYARRLGRLARAGEIPGRFARIVQQAVAGKPYGAAPVDLAGSSDFERQVLLLLRRIPRGEVRPYFWLACQAGRPKAVRAVGATMARNPLPFILPCHRIVPATGGLGGYAFGRDLKRELLRREGVPVEELERPAQGGARYIGCRTTHIYCFPTCHHARRIKPENRVALANVKQAESSGYRPCSRCRPPALA